MYLSEVKSGPSFRIFAIAQSEERCLLYDFFGDLDPKFEKNIRAMLALFKLVADSGIITNTYVSHKIAPQIFQFEKGRLRVAYFFDDNKLIICTHGFLKKSQKTTKKDIDRAKRSKDEYFLAKTKKEIIILEGKENVSNRL